MTTVNAEQNYMPNITQAASIAFPATLAGTNIHFNCSLWQGAPLPSPSPWNGPSWSNVKTLSVIGLALGGLIVLIVALAGCYLFKGKEEKTLPMSQNAGAQSYAALQ